MYSMFINFFIDDNVVIEITLAMFRNEIISAIRKVSKPQTNEFEFTNAC